MKQNIGKLNELADVAAGMYDCPVVCHSPNLKFLICSSVNDISVNSVSIPSPIGDCELMAMKTVEG